MESKVFLNNDHRPVLLLAVLLSVLVSGCASQPTRTPMDLPRPEAVQPPAERPVDPGQAAARQLIERGRRHLEDHQPDAAIRDLERALSLHSTDGETYFWLAEAWLMKIDARRAGDFNRMAEYHFKDDPGWLVRIAGQADRIAELEK